MSDFTPKTRLEKILCGVVTTAKTRLEKAVKYAVEHAGSGGGGGSGVMFVTLQGGEDSDIEASASIAEICEAFRNGPVFIMYDGNVATVYEADDEDNAVLAYATFIRGVDVISLQITGTIGPGGQDMWTANLLVKNNAKLTADATFSKDQETNLNIISFSNLVARDLYNAILAGETIEVHSEIPVSGGVISIVTCPAVSCKKSEGESTFYEFSFVDADTRDGAASYASPSLAENDYVVFEQVEAAGN